MNMKIERSKESKPEDFSKVCLKVVAYLLINTTIFEVRNNPLGN